MSDYIKRMLREKKVYAWATPLFFVAVVLVIFGIDLYRRTIIDPWILVGVVAVGTLLAILIMWRKLRSGAGFLSTAFLCAAIGGGTLYFLFLFLNKSFMSATLTREEFSIEDASVSGRYHQPFVDIIFYGQKKELIFKGNDIDHPIENYTTVRLQYGEGWFGFPYIEQQELLLKPD